jgi:3-dehydroquinate synthetase
MIDAIGKDKKREKDRMHFVLLEEIGKAVVQDITLQELQAFIPD